MGLLDPSDRLWLEPPADYPVLDLRTETPEQCGDWPTDPDELTLFVHGLGGDRERRWVKQAYTLDVAARRNGLDLTQVATVYPTIDESLDWQLAVDNARTAGRKLARWLRDVDDAADVSSYNVVAHSLGAHVTGALLDALAGDVVLDYAGLLGAAVPADAVCGSETPYARGMIVSASAIHSYRSRDDEVICGLYAEKVLADDEHGLGCGPPDCPASLTLPAQFWDHDVTDDVDKHWDYIRPRHGCVPDIVDHFDAA